MLIPYSMTAEEIRLAAKDDKPLCMLSENVLPGWPSTKTEVQKEPYWSFRDEIVIIDGIAMKDRRIIVPTSLQRKAIKQLHINHVG